MILFTSKGTMRASRFLIELTIRHLTRFNQEKKAVCSSQQYVLVTERKQIHTSSIAYPATRG